MIMLWFLNMLFVKNCKRRGTHELRPGNSLIDEK
jgi:hypothetical protein